MNMLNFILHKLQVEIGWVIGACILLSIVLLVGYSWAIDLGNSERSSDNAVWRDSPKLSDLFDGLRAQSGLEGTFVLYDREEKVLIGYNEARANTHYQPASTFKILNALIAFETGEVRDLNEILPYGGGPQPVPAWEKNMTIQEAMAVSNVPLFQGIARRIGLERMRKYVRQVNYGNAEIGQVVDNFWLKGPLAISALEQIRFIDELNRNELPFSARSMELVREIVPREENRPPGVVFYKTGWVTNTQPGIGWVVGWVRYDGRDYPFALNLDINKAEDADMRLTVTWRALQELFGPF